MNNIKDLDKIKIFLMDERRKCISSIEVTLTRKKLL